jgi:hypothetical protein
VVSLPDSGIPILIPTSPPSNYPMASIVSPVLGHSQPNDSLQSSEQDVTGVSTNASHLEPEGASTLTATVFMDCTFIRRKSPCDCRLWDAEITSVLCYRLVFTDQPQCVKYDPLKRQEG